MGPITVAAQGYPMSTSDDIRMSGPLEVRFASDGKAGIVSGYASVFGGEPDIYGDVIAPGAFRKSLSAAKSSGRLPVMLWSHDMSKPIGRWTDMSEDAKGLTVRGQLNLDTAAGRDAFAHLKAGDVDGFSIGYRVPAGGRTAKGKGVFLLTQIDLVEVSIVAVPAASSARVETVKSAANRREIERMLHDNCGLSRKQAARFTAAGWRALAPDGKSPTESINQLAARIKSLSAEMRKS